jgi:regulator of sigma E protease
LNQIAAFVWEIVRSIDLNPKRPTYTQAKSSGMGDGNRRGFNVSLGTIPSYGESKDGLPIDGVRDASPAAKAGLKAGDKIIKLANREIRNISDYTVVLGDLKPNVEYEIVVERGNETLTLKIVPAARQ